METFAKRPEARFDGCIQDLALSGIVMKIDRSGPTFNRMVEEFFSKWPL